MSAFLPREKLQVLLDALREEGYRCLGPQVRDGAIVYDDLDDVGDLPRGVRDSQGPGRYRLDTADDPYCFAWADGPQALKPLVFAPREVLWKARREGARIGFSEVVPEAEPLAVIGVRACDLAALNIQDKHFLHSAFPDPYYRKRRGLFLVAVHCTHPAETCFCASTGDGPKATFGYDLALSELEDGFLVEARSAKGQRIFDRLPLEEATPGQVEAAEAVIREAAQRQVRSLPSRNLKETLFARLDHPRWEEVGNRCLACGNCTSVCPTCFCHAEVEVPALGGEETTHVREWDSCFTAGHSYIHGLVLRDSTRLRYRQWLTHKLGSWHDQYGRSGCVGCGRCITWCPVGIDITEEVSAIHGSLSSL
ncbi:MAG: sulfite reductase subunit A [Gammaproteobacteria bacterium]|nr:MAG: sulfite reductase subunit A [Gammaproteobacteria bacterium]